MYFAIADAPYIVLNIVNVGYLSHATRAAEREPQRAVLPGKESTVTHKPHGYGKCDGGDAHDDDLHRYLKGGAS
jgi:hypothetical protein